MVVMFPRKQLFLFIKLKFYCLRLTWREISFIYSIIEHTHGHELKRKRRVLNACYVLYSLKYSSLYICCVCVRACVRYFFVSIGRSLCAHFECHEISSCYCHHSCMFKYIKLYTSRVFYFIKRNFAFVPKLKLDISLLNHYYVCWMQCNV